MNVSLDFKFIDVSNPYSLHSYKIKQKSILMFKSPYPSTAACLISNHNSLHFSLKQFSPLMKGIRHWKNQPSNKILTLQRLEITLSMVLQPQSVPSYLIVQQSWNPSLLQTELPSSSPSLSSLRKLCTWPYSL